jgi:putative restriction endonuclease
MAKAILTTKIDPAYDDLPEERYHFPRTYLRQVQGAVGDWIVYYEPRRSNHDLSSRGGRQAYFATARLDRIQADPSQPDHFYAFVTDYLAFDHPVSFRDGEQYFEAALVRNDGKTNKGAFGRAVRPISDQEYDLILRAGFTRTLGEVTSGDRPAQGLFEEEAASFERPLVERVVSRPFRDVAFVVAVKEAYGNTCAVTGFKIINGGGRAEVQAAHIRPVAHNGPDSIRNGIALSGTAHWLFDRGLISVGDDYTILIAKDRVPEPVVRFLREDRRALVPERPDQQPHGHFLRYHRENIFKG